MSNKRVHCGWIKEYEDVEDHDTITLNDNPLAEELEYMNGKIVTVRYYISNKEATEEELMEDFLINTLYGKMTSKYGAVYSEYTGYLWTNDDLKIGGHDLLNELSSYVGKYLYLIVEIDVEEENKRIYQDNLRRYNRFVRDVVECGERLNKSLDDIIFDIKNEFS